MIQIFSRVDHKKIIAHVLENHKSFNLPAYDPNTCSIKLLTFRRSGLNSLLNFMISYHGQPAIVIKIPRYREGVQAFTSLKHEHEMLARLYKMPKLSQNVPQAAQLHTVDQVPILMTKAATGPMLHTLLDGEENIQALSEHLSRGTRLLFELAASPAPPVIVNDEFIEKYLVAPLKSILEYYPGIINEVEAFLNKLFSGQSFRGLGIPLSLTHCEYNPYNLLMVNQTDPLLFDWEDAQLKGLPGLDLYNYFSVAFRLVFIGESAGSQKRALPEKIKRANLLLAQFNDIGHRYCQLIKLPAAALDLLYVLFAVQNTAFFLADKRREINYGNSWISMLLLPEAQNCFGQYVVREISAMERKHK